MNAVFIAVRAVHFASAMLLFGELMFVVVVASPACRDAGRSALGQGEDAYRRLLLVASWSLAASVASGAAWLAVEATVMSGMPLEQALNFDTLALVLGKTVFGRIWLMRCGLVIALCLLSLAIWRSADDKRRLRSATSAVVVAAAYLATLAWAGHAAGASAAERYVHMASDIVHLLATGAWLGALPGLVFLLGGALRAPGAEALDAATRVVRRFSTMGLASVSALVLSGLANTWYLVGDVPALVGTDYGRLLLAKLALFAAMATFAAVNHWHLTPRLDRFGQHPLRLLRRNAVLETVAGIAVVTIVGALGITPPAAHQAPIWPFDYTFSWQPAQQSISVRVAIAVDSIVGLVAAGVAFGGARRRQPRLWIAGLAGMVAAAATCGWLLAVPAHPTTYVVSPVRYTTNSIVRGADRYARSCAACHGRDGLGDGPATSSLSSQPANLVEHATHHRAGEVYWSIAHGIPGTPMPGFASQMSDAEIWDLIQFLRARSEAEDATALIRRVEPWRPIVAPDFTFQVAARTQESLQQQRGRYIALVVFYTLPQSLPRLRALAAERNALEQAGARVIAVPTSASSTSAASDTLNLDESMFVMTSPDVAAAYTMFARRKDTARGDVARAHIELLIDRQGYLRARWIGVPDAAVDRMTWMLAQIELLNHEPPSAQPADGHAH